MRQQGALYLSRKKRHSQAFAWIDDAVTQSGGRNLSIRNSHAVILFRANFGRDPNDPTVRRTLEQSMDILSECYSQDKRKIYHALTFGEQAIQYWDLYGDQNATVYLQTADKWLGEEEKNAPWDRSLTRLRRRVSDILARM